MHFHLCCHHPDHHLNSVENISEAIATTQIFHPASATVEMFQVVTIEDKLSAKYITATQIFHLIFQVVTIEDELSAIGENQKQLEVSEEKARRREEKYQVKQ